MAKSDYPITVKEINTGKRPTRGKRTSGSGERSARFGFNYQDRSAARLVYDALLDQSLRWVGFADRTAGVVDDLVLGLIDRTEAYQFKRSAKPQAVGIKSLFLGTQCVIADMAQAYVQLCEQDDQRPVQVRHVTNDFESENDTLIEGDASSSTYNFVQEWKSAPGRSLNEWLETKWKPLVLELLQQSRLPPDKFEVFWNRLKLVTGSDADLILNPVLDQISLSQIEHLSNVVGKLVGDNPQKDRWSTDELLLAVGWNNRFRTRFSHSFQLGGYVQKNYVTETEIETAIATHKSGYISLVGPPGAGKSTLLQRAIRAKVGHHVARYLAFVPGTAQGQGRGEADSFLDDLIAQLATSGLQLPRFQDHSTVGRQQTFENLLVAAGHRFTKQSEKTIIVVDGLDHVPSEENPERSFLALLPLPGSIPEGVIFVLGTQRLELADIPPSVRESASTAERRIEIAPLSIGAVRAMITSMGLPDTVDAEVLYSASKGHPLVSQYLLGRLKASPIEQHTSILESELPFDGDLDAVYRAALRSIGGVLLADEVKKVLAVLAHAEGIIEPEILATLTNEEAVEAVLRDAGHLLHISPHGWRIFHNSFRLFLRRHPILKFGKPDPNYASAAVYSALADKASQAGPQSQQRWLEFRYLFLSGNMEAAIAVASRAYFVRQYCEGRSVEAIEGDIASSFLASKVNYDAAKLFDLLLCCDDIRRREQIMEDVNSLSDAYLELGDLGAAEAALERGYKEGEQWRVVAALLDDGHVQRARSIFEGNSLLDRFPQGLTNADLETVSNWAPYALQFLEFDQIKAEIVEATSRPNDDDLPSNPNIPEDLLEPCMFQIALAQVRADPKSNIAEVAKACGVGLSSASYLVLEAAWTAFNQDNQELALVHIQNLSTLDWEHHLHQYGLWKAARVALWLGLDAQAKTIALCIEACGFQPIELAHRLHAAPEISAQLLRSVSAQVACGLQVPALDLPNERLLRGLQHHILQVAGAIGRVRRGDPAEDIGIRRIWTAAIQFLASARTGTGEDFLVGHQMQSCSKILVGGILHLVNATKGEIDEPARLVDQLCANQKTIFKWWPEFRIFIAVETYSLNGIAEAAIQRLESAMADCFDKNITVRVQETVNFALAFAKVGAVGRTKGLLTELKPKAIGIWAPAKKDGIYEMWASVLRLANASDPANRNSRSPIALRLLSMLAHGEGYDMANRICREILFEASAAGPQEAWNAVAFGATSKHIGWDSILDSVLRGTVHRRPELIEAATILWNRICLPWYHQPYVSSVPVGQFLVDTFALVNAKDVARFEKMAVDAIQSVGRSDTRRQLLQVLLKAAGSKGGGRGASDAFASLSEQTKSEKERESELAESKPISLKEIATRFETHATVTGQITPPFANSAPHADFPYDLRVAAAASIEQATWKDAWALFEKFPILGQEPRTAFALLESAVRSGETNAALKLLEEVVEPVAKGWCWSSGKDRRRYHEWRNRLMPDVDQSSISTDFANDMAQSSYAPSSAVCEIDEIFPLLYKSVPWSEIWDMVVSQLAEWDEFQNATLTLPNSVVETDHELLASLLVWAFDLAIPVIATEARSAFSELLNAGYESIAGIVIDQLFDSGDVGTLQAVELLLENHTVDGLAKRFSIRLAKLVKHPDLGIAAIASYLGFLWQVEIRTTCKSLPAFYSLQLPDQDVTRDGQMADERTRGLIIDEPMAWTAEFETWTAQLAEIVDVPQALIRRRVGQLISNWGGVEAFGHKGTELLEAKLDDCGLKLAYQRPQFGAVFRALRYIAGDFWHAELLPRVAFHDLLRLFRVHPERPLLPEFGPRPRDIVIDEPTNIWGHDGPKWLDGLLDCTKVGIEADNNGWVLASTYTAVFKRSRTEATEHFCSWHVSAEIEIDSDFEHHVSALPRVLWHSRPIPVYRVDSLHLSCCAIYEPRTLQVQLATLLVFCPYIAQRLGWVPAKGSVHVYLNKSGDEMVKTLCWRDGLDQSIEDDGAVLEGQSVVLTDLGRAQFEAIFNKPKHRGTIWRTIAEERRSKPPEVRAATVAQIPWMIWT